MLLKLVMRTVVERLSFLYSASCGIDGFIYLACTPGKGAADACLVQSATSVSSSWFSSGMLNSSLSVELSCLSAFSAEFFSNFLNS